MIRFQKIHRMQRWLMICGVLTLLAMSATVDAKPPGVVFPGYYPEEFSGVGRIVRIAEDRIVINDELFHLSPRATYHTLDQEYAFKASFRSEMLVGFITSSSGKEIVSLWFIQK